MVTRANHAFTAGVRVLGGWLLLLHRLTETVSILSAPFPALGSIASLTKYCTDLLPLRQ